MACLSIKKIFNIFYSAAFSSVEVVSSAAGASAFGSAAFFLHHLRRRVFLAGAAACLCLYRRFH